MGMMKKNETKLKRWVVKVFDVSAMYQVTVHAATKDDAEREGRSQVDCERPNVTKSIPTTGIRITHSYENPEYEKPKLKKLCGRESLGSGLHMALRKCCDSKPTTAAWCLISSEECNEVWTIYLDSAWALLSQITKAKAIVPCLEAATEGIHCLEDHGDLGNALYSIFDLFDDKDWEGFASYLISEG
jgi:hypothetical protein